MSIFRALLALVAAMLVASPAAAFWEYGHETVAAIAWDNIKPATRTAIRHILAAEKTLNTPTCPARTIEQASVWPDCVKPLKDAEGKSRFGYAYSWHYQNVNICEPFDLVPACKDGDCVSTQIDRQRAILADRHATPRARVMALAFLVHFVGDLHQPLHAGDKGDKGGNEAKADYGIYAPARMNLHSIWDGLLAERAISTPPPLVKRYPLATRRRLAAGTTTDWSRESWQAARTAYATAMHGDPCQPTPARLKLTDADVAQLVPLLRGEVVKGGLRLARLLDSALG
ncbi:S1/P1 nuclease [Sphingomonas sp. KR1UV-12]|uniref:S1/P1 nuclease n=1 Tax=Sphingomonas aurea TaxID=3063994 RepID=A0ABT9ENM4_9SPHN|nr:S1/P1 nuclease [Sphingomonas sp. KR1UV-12]MDP1028560.1 S1/P1 nuclease [Sphingomonas sp. KR1UV-12]